MRGNTKHLDETAGNNLNMACSHGSVLAGNGENFGTWSNFEMCPEGQAVCGIRTLGIRYYSFKRRSHSFRYKYNYSS